MAPQITTVGVVGLGTMGAGIAEVFARQGLRVVGVEQTADQLARGVAHVERSTARAVERGKLSEAEQQATLDRLEPTTELSDLAGCDLVVEAVVERLEAKCAIFCSLDEIVRPETVLATNTSSLSVTEIAAATRHPGRVVGMHFFNPAPVQRLVEVIRTVVTEPGVVTAVTDLAEHLGKRSVVVGDRAGFIANALLFGYLNSAVAMYDSGHASREDIDTAMRLGCGYPMGPLALLDLIGLDTAHEILATMYEQSGNRLHAPAPLLRQLVTAGLLGRKVGRGFYSYRESGGVGAAGADVATRFGSTGPAASEQGVEAVIVVGSGARARELYDALSGSGHQVALFRDDVLLDPSQAVVELKPLSGCAMVIEAVGGDSTRQHAVLAQLGSRCSDSAVIVVTTSTTSVAHLAAVTGRPTAVVGLHLVDFAGGPSVAEVVAGVSTAPESVDRVRALLASSDLHPVVCRDRAGFIVDALLFPYLNDAVRMLESGYATADEVDTAMTLGCALPLGPFEQLDRLGTDVALARQQAVFAETREPGHAPAPLLAHLVMTGRLGSRTGRGFRDHPHNA